MHTQLLLAAFFLGAAGCGVADYERQIDAQRARVAEYDELNRMLDDPLEIPMIQVARSKEEGPAWPAEFYLRLPKGFGNTPKDKILIDSTFPMYRYAGGDSALCIFVAVANVQEVTKPPKPAEFGTYTIDYFRYRVRDVLATYQMKAHKLNLPFPAKLEYGARKVRSFSAYADSPELRFDTLELSDAHIKGRPNPTTFDIFMFEDKAKRDEAKKQACVVIHRPAGKQNADHRKIIDASLGTLDLSPDAAGKRAQFKKAR